MHTVDHSSLRSVLARPFSVDQEVVTPAPSRHRNRLRPTSIIINNSYNGDSKLCDGTHGCVYCIYLFRMRRRLLREGT